MNAGEWLAGEAVPAVADYVYEPMLQAFYFQPLVGTSRALAMAVAAFGLHRPRTMTVEGGIGRIPDTLAAGLDVRLGSPVLRLEIDAHGVSADTPSGALEADHVIVAAPAPVARELLSDAATEAEEALLACTYSGTINICLGLRAGFRLPSALRDVYGVLIPARERLNVAAISVERNKSPDRARHGELLEAFLSGDASERLVGTSDEEILAVVLDELERYLPAISGAVITTHLIRWPVAEPRSPVGRASAVATYHRTPRSDRRVLLAGDYVAFPWTDGAAEAGTWAAAQLLSHAVPPIRPRPTR
jgi:oxygen-dependent protoporphyrinogen oxidase